MMYDDRKNNYWLDRLELLAIKKQKKIVCVGRITYLLVRVQKTLE